MVIHAVSFVRRNYKEVTMSIDLNKLANKLDEVLKKETTETLTKFLTDKRMSNKKQQSSIELFAIALYEKGFLQGNGDEINDLLNSYKSIHKLELEELSAGWAKLREQTRETAMHIGFARGFETGLECYEDYYQELDKTDMDEDEFTRNYITDRFEETYDNNK